MNIKIRNRLLIFTSVLILTISLVYAGDAKHYRPKSKEYSVTYPYGWEVVEKTDTAKRTEVHILSQKEGKGDLLREGVSILGYTHDPNISLEQFYTINKTNLQKMYKVVDEGSETINGVPAKWVVCVPQKGVKVLKTTHYFFAKGDKKYVLTAAIDTRQESRYKPVLLWIIRSFRIK